MTLRFQTSLFAGGLYACCAHLGRGLGDVLFPCSCTACSQPHDSKRGDAFCEHCRAQIDDARARPACPKCASDVACEEVAQNHCRLNRDRHSNLSAMTRVGSYASPIGPLLRLFKYKHRDETGVQLAKWLAEKIRKAEWFDRVEAITVVPTLRRRRLFRPYYTAEVLARRVSRETQRVFCPLLRRVRAGRHQIGLTYLQRIKNVRGAFDLKPFVRLERARVLIIDDVKTTGATLNECAKVLKRGGAKEVYAGVVTTVDWEADAGRVLNDI